MGDGDEGAMYSTRPASGYNVCADCIDDDKIKQFIERCAEEHFCDFCGHENDIKDIAAPLDEVVEFMHRSIAREYQRAVEALGYETAEGGYQGIYWDSEELLTGVIGLSLPNDDDGQLLDIIVDCLGCEPWCERNPYSLSEDEKLAYSWEHFCELIKHERRYFFLKQAQQHAPDLSEHLSPGELLQLIGDTVIEHGLVQTLPQGTLIHRARRQKPGEALESSFDLGPPLPEAAIRSNRMSPAGIVMFYGSSEPETAIAEIDDDPTLGIVVGTFKTTKDLRVLDLTNLPERISFFQPESSCDRYALNFLHKFVRSLAEKVEPGDREHIEYVPTQVVTEWFRSVFQHGDSQIDGIYYPSAPRKGGRSIVLFADRDNLRLTPEECKDLIASDPTRAWGLQLYQEKTWLQLVQVIPIRQPKYPQSA